MSRIGVIKDPPPTPVMPTAKPTMKPDTTKGRENKVMRKFTIVAAAGQRIPFLMDAGIQGN